VYLGSEIAGIEMRKPSKLRIGCVISLLITLVLVVGFIWAAFSWEDDFRFVNRRHAHGVSEVFTLSLMQNRGEIAKSLVDPSQWLRLERWMDEHQAVTCPPPRIGIPDEPTWWSLSSDADVDNSGYHIPVLILTLPCPNESRLYRLEIEDIELRQTEEGWLIEDWGRVLEEWPG
jgi:hypothetical protein